PAAAPDLLEAGRAVDGPVAARLERHARLAAAVRAGRREQLPARTLVAIVAPRATVARGVVVALRAVGVAAALSLAGLTALRAAAGVVRQPPALVELLLPGREGELPPAVAAGQNAVLKNHRALLLVRIGRASARITRSERSMSRPGLCVRSYFLKYRKRRPTGANA